jgi:hypothetical protein
MIDKTTKQLTETDVRKIAKEEALKVQQNVLKEISEIKETLSRLERLLLGELGTNEEDTLKSRANIAYLYAKKNIDSRVIERAEPALKWFEDMNTPDKGCEESKLDILGKIITAWSSVKWLAGLFGVINLATLIALGILIMNFIKLVKELGL